ncbi:hypothetical protein A3Q56_00147 [Intoshia linei]|uniref:Uncharacterized protein n=1 Tax=Intoshia linei TaxID=1819745 RepID=A0A177BCZ8_9BILA|nr:hypothetical protein A3Q56_00147 [Intoshia linei]
MDDGLLFKVKYIYEDQKCVDNTFLDRMNRPYENLNVANQKRPLFHSPITMSHLKDSRESFINF